MMGEHQTENSGSTLSQVHASGSQDKAMDGEDKAGRAKPFLHEELVDMVRYLHRRRYESAQFCKSNHRKSKILKKLAVKLAQRYGTIRTARQLQKRFSDFKVRQQQLLQDIYAEIRQEKDERFNADPIYPETGVVESREPVKELMQTEIEECITHESEVSSTAGSQEMVTLNLVPIMPCNFDFSPSQLSKSTQTDPITLEDLHKELAVQRLILEEVIVKLDYVVNHVNGLNGH